MKQTKPFRMSKTLRWILLILIPLLKQLWVGIGIDDIILVGDGLNSIYAIAVQLVGAILAIYWRLKADKDIRFTLK